MSRVPDRLPRACGGVKWRLTLVCVYSGVQSTQGEYGCAEPAAESGAGEDEQFAGEGGGQGEDYLAALLSG